MEETVLHMLEVRTADGLCPVALHTPTGTGSWAGVLLYMDAPGIRPALHEIAARIARAGYAVALPDLFYRSGPYAPIDPRIVFADPALRAAHRVRFTALLPTEGAMADSRAVIGALRADPRIAGGPIGVVGYCMGGRLALTAAGTFPGEVAVAAAFHAGHLADDQPTSPHRLAARMRAQLFVAGATDDPAFPDAQKERLAAALTEAGVAHRVETWPARHGWVPRDTAAHDPVQAERHVEVLLPFLDRVLRPR